MSGTTDSPDASLRRIGRYTFVREIASGGMATVFLARARDGGVERDVAIKRLHPHLATEDEFVSMFFDEARLAARIRHPNVVATLEVDDLDGLSIVMEYVDGPTLLEMARCEARRGARLPPPVVARVALDLLAGLAVAHDLRGDDGAPLELVHRDVSPHNVLVGVDGVARLTDFGIARASVRLSHTRDGQMKGKIAYMAPEQVVADACDRRADLFAAGVVLWELFSGRRLFAGSSDAQILYALLQGQIPSVRSVVPDLPEGLDATLAKALSRDPDARWSSAAEFAAALSKSIKPCARAVVAVFAKRARDESMGRAAGRPSVPSAPSHVRRAERKALDPGADATVMESPLELDDGDILRSSPPATRSTPPPSRVSVPPRPRAPRGADDDDEDLLSTMVRLDRTDDEKTHALDTVPDREVEEPTRALRSQPPDDDANDDVTRALDHAPTTTPADDDRSADRRAVWWMGAIALTLVLAALAVTFARR
ncbi:MAG: serine/threonine-protein kinase [Polyangiales bacterium]